MPAVPNPFYRTSSSNPPPSTNPTSPPPAYRSTPPPAPPTRPTNSSTGGAGGPITYSSLSDLTKGRTAAPPPNTKSGFSYTPDPSRGGYRSGFEDSSGGVPGGGSGAASGRRNMPPPPSNYGVEIPREPPRRNVREWEILLQEPCRKV